MGTYKATSSENSFEFERKVFGIIQAAEFHNTAILQLPLSAPGDYEIHPSSYSNEFFKTRRLHFSSLHFTYLLLLRIVSVVQEDIAKHATFYPLQVQCQRFARFYFHSVSGSN